MQPVRRKSDDSTDPTPRLVDARQSTTASVNGSTLTPQRRRQALESSSSLRADAFWPALPNFWQQYRYVRTLGSGTTGDVVLMERTANDTDAPKRVAVKMLKDGDAQTSSFWQNEVNILRAFAPQCRANNLLCYVQHARVPLDSSSRRLVPAIITEHIAGKELFDWTQEYWAKQPSSVKLARAPPANVVQIVLTDILRALAFLHSLDIAHRDIKPENIMLQLRADGMPERAVLIDLGFACRGAIGCARRSFAGTACYASAGKLRRHVAPVMLSGGGDGPELLPPLSSLDSQRKLQQYAKRVAQLVSERCSSRASKRVRAACTEMIRAFASQSTALQTLKSADMWAFGLTMQAMCTGEQPMPCQVSDALESVASELSAANFQPPSLFVVLSTLERFLTDYEPGAVFAAVAAQYGVDDRHRVVIGEMLRSSDSGRISASDALRLVTANVAPSTTVALGKRQRGN